MPDPSISIITINRDAGATVERTILSVLAQDLPFQWVVVDGGSTDASLAALSRAVRPGDAMLSEPDRGISDAFNKGLALASGEAVLFMNAGDEFASPDALRRLAEAWNHKRHRWISGSAEVVDETGMLLYRRDMRQPADPRDLIRNHCRIFHQATLAERRMLLDAGGFDLSYRIGMDYEMWCRLLCAGHIPQVVPVTVCRYRVGGVSGDVRLRHVEHRRARAANGISNPWWFEFWLGLIAWAKGVLRGCVGGWAYRLKERLRL